MRFQRLGGSIDRGASGLRGITRPHVDAVENGRLVIFPSHEHVSHRGQRAAQFSRPVGIDVLICFRPSPFSRHLAGMRTCWSRFPHDQSPTALQAQFTVLARKVAASDR